MKDHKSHISSKRSKSRGWRKIPTKEDRDETKGEMVKYQLANCQGCKFAAEKAVGTGIPFCTYPGSLLVEDGVCLKFRNKEQK